MTNMLDMQTALTLKSLARTIAGVAHALQPLTKQAYVKQNLAARMGKETGKKRLRKKKAQVFLRWEYALLHNLARPLARRIGYAEVARQVFSIEPLPASLSAP